VSSTRGELDAAAAAVEKRDPQALLERPDGARERRLRDVKRLGRAPEMQPLGHRYEIPQLPQFRQIHAYRVLQPRANSIGPRLRGGGQSGL
jgi:hypothetical protein